MLSGNRFCGYKVRACNVVDMHVFIGILYASESCELLTVSPT